MHLTLIQTSLHWQNADANFAMLAEKIKQAGPTDLILLPEMFTTGFSMQPQEYASNPQEIVDWLVKQAFLHNTAICGSTMVKEHGKFYNRLFFVQPDATVITYNKKHLFTLAGEQKVYTAGDRQVLIKYKGWRIKPLICYDLRFPVWSRNTEDYDLLIYVANWPAKRSEAWQSLLKSRAIENMCYVAGLNRVGADGNGIAHSGNSVVHDCLGKPVLEFDPEKEAIKSIFLNKEHLIENRQRFGFLGDRDSFKLLD